MWNTISLDIWMEHGWMKYCDYKIVYIYYTYSVHITYTCEYYIGVIIDRYILCEFYIYILHYVSNSITNSCIYILYVLYI